MTDPAILEALAKAMNGPHLPVPGDSKHTIAELRDIKWQNIGKGDRQNFLNQAAAVLELVGPKPLVWSMPDKNGWRRAGEYHLGPCNTAERQWGYGLVLSKISWHPTLEAAQAAAQAHADAAHWANTQIGGE